ncbi:MAG TPA: ClbS/DfsB family four-helix bundle protein [Ktedonobacterales bacterium]|nr:ClbS/DfsB family four-helix bundle protein [Ktedonobacterales bacterium]
MSGPTQPATKDELLAMIQTGYEQFEALLATISQERMTAASTGDDWSVKDHLAHLAAWQGYQAGRMEATAQGAPAPPALVPGVADEEAINAALYARNKDRPLAVVLADWHASYQRALAATRALSWEALNGPFPWQPGGAPVMAYTLGNTADHYEEHHAIIQRWLAAHA